MVKAEHIAWIIQVTHQYLACQTEAITERQLVIELTRHGIWDDLGKSSAIIQQFQKHFLTMHALYRLQAKLDNSHTRLHISPDAIYISNLDQEDSSARPTAQEEETEEACAAERALRDYYLDLKQMILYQGTVAHSADEYQRRHLSIVQHGDAYAALELNAGANWAAVQSAYRQKAVQFHPDKGGNAQDFQRIREAYQYLKSALRP